MVLGIISNLEMISSIREDEEVVCIYYTILYKGLEHPWFWYLWGSWNQFLPTVWVLSLARKLKLREAKWPSQVLNWGPVVFFKTHERTSLVAQWLRISLPVRGTRVRALVREDPTCRRTTKPVRHNYRAWASKAREPQLLKPTRLEPVLLQQEKPPQWEARAPQRRVAPARRN